MSDKKDEIKVTEKLGDGYYRGLRRNDEGEQTGVFKIMSDGEAALPGAELISVDMRDCRDGWHGVQSIHKSGPAQVATPEYRDGWDRIFGKKPEVGLA